MDEALAGRRPTRIVGAVVGLFILAVVVGRLLLAGGVAWALLFILLPIIVVALGVGIGFRVAVLLTAAFTGLVLAVRWLLASGVAAWVVLLLLPVVVFTAVLVGRVLGMLRHRDEGTPPAEHDAAEDAGSTP